MFLNNYYNILLNHTKALLNQCPCVMFILLMQLVNVAQFLKHYILLTLVAATGATAMFGTVIVPLTSIYASL